MFKIKKAISALSIASLLTASSTGFVFASVPADVTGTEHQNAVEVLSSLGIMVGDADTGLFRPNDSIKRSEVAKVAVALKGLGEIASTSAASKFPDVGINHWANGYINTATAQGLVIGDDTGNFRPDDKITFSEAVTIMTRALGYEPQALSKGGYPTGYIISANSNGLSKGVTTAANKEISRADVARLAKNALTIKLMEQVNYGSNEKYEITEKTLLSECLEIDLIEGAVTAVGSASIDGAPIDKNKIKIDGKVYNVGSADIRNLLGFNVEAYIANGSGGKRDTLLLAQAAEDKNSVVRINADNLHSVENNTVKYLKDEKLLKATLASDATIIYNGKKGEMSDLKPIDSGSVILLDSEKNGKYNIVFVNETVNYVVDEVSASSKRVTDKYDQGSIVLDPADDDVSYVIDKAGKIIEAKDLEEWDVITLTMSKDKSLIYGTVVKNPVEGKIEETDKDGVYIGGKKYKVASSYPHSLKIGNSGTFYLDAEGKIAAYGEDKSSGKNYAYLVDMQAGTGINGKLKFKLFTKEGKAETLNAASKMSVNDKSGLKGTAVIDAIGEKGQLVTYELNSSGEIYKINTPQSSNDVNEDKFVLNFSESEVKYSASSSKLLAGAMNVKVAPSTLIFDIPASSSSSDDYSVRDVSFLSDGGKYDISVYDVKENLTAGVIVVTNSDSKASHESAIAIVEKITSSKDENGNETEKLYAYQNGKKIVLYSSDKAFRKNGSEKLESGDIIQFNANTKGEVDAVSVLFDINNASKEQSVKHSENMITEYGKITKKFADSFNLQVNGGAVNNYAIGDASIYVVETARSKVSVSTGNASDIQKYDSINPERVFVRIYKDSVKEIVVVRQ